MCVCVKFWDRTEFWLYCWLRDSHQRLDRRAVTFCVCENQIWENSIESLSLSKFICWGVCVISRVLCWGHCFPMPGFPQQHRLRELRCPAQSLTPTPHCSWPHPQSLWHQVMLQMRWLAWYGLISLFFLLSWHSELTRVSYWPRKGGKGEKQH